MAGNTFGPPGGMVPLYDSRLVRANRDRFRRDEFPEIERANSFYISNGRWPSSGWLLLKRSDYNTINTYATNLQLSLDDLNTFTPAVTFKNLVIVQARCVSRGVAADPTAIYLVQITDSQGIIYNPWAQFPTNSQYNVRSPAYPEQYYSDSLSAGTTPWTWDQMCGDLWGQMGAFLGTYPKLPITPLGTPENFIFPGLSCWEALNQVMDYLGLTIACDLTKATNQYAIVVAGATDSAFASLQTKYQGFLEDDFEWIDTGSGRAPGQMVVYFHVRYQYYGTEETVRRDGFQWASTPLYQVTVPAPATFASAAGTGYLFSEFTVRLDVNGVPLPADVTTAAAIAAERVSQYYNKIYRGTAGFLRQVYTGVIPFITGSLVDGVRYFQTYKLSAVIEERAGWRTEIIRGYFWPEVTFPLTAEGITGE